MSDDRATAKRLLVHYFGMIAKRAGMPWEPDNTAEVEAAVDAMVEASADLAESRMGRDLEAALVYAIRANGFDDHERALIASFREGLKLQR